MGERPPIHGNAATRASNGRVRFGTFEVDLRAGELRKAGLKIKLHGQPFDVLTMLLERSGEVVTREELQQKLWPSETFVDFEHGLNKAINKLRESLSDDANNARYIETLPRHGYRFIAAIVPDTTQSDQKHLPLKRWVIWLSTAALFAIAAVLFFVDFGDLRRKLFSRSAAEPQIRSLAVLPLTNLSGDPEQEYFADGMTEELISELSRISSLRVISRTSVMQYKGEKKKPLSEIARELNADAVMEGSVLRSGNRVRIAVQLIYAPTDQHLWVGTYERNLGDVLKLQGEVAEAITQQVRPKLSLEWQGRFRQAQAVNPEAYEAYLTALSFDCCRLLGIKKAQAYFEKAIQKDPGFARAYVGLASTYIDLGEMRWQAPQDAYPSANQALEKALNLDEKNCGAHSALLWLRWRSDWDWPSAERELKYALELCPNSAQIHRAQAYYSAWNGRGAEAMAELAKARELDPLNPGALHVGAGINYHLRDYKAMIEVSRQYVAWDPNRWLAHYWLGSAMKEQAKRWPQSLNIKRLSNCPKATRILRLHWHMPMRSPVVGRRRRKYFGSGKIS